MKEPTETQLLAKRLKEVFPNERNQEVLLNVFRLGGWSVARCKKAFDLSKLENPVGDENNDPADDLLTD